MTIRSVSLKILCLSLIAVAGTVGQQCRNIHVANVKSIFALAPSPAGSDLLFYGSAEEAEGEVVTGRLFRLRLDRPENGLEQLKAPDASNPPSPVWQPDGSAAYFETDQGIYQLRSAGESAELLWKGPSEGLALSPDGLLLAFWRVQKGAHTLILYDLRKKLEKRAWRVPDRFESDKSGWDVAFAQNGHALYARTYDQTSATPLKRFDVRSGQVTTVSSNCYAVAEGKRAVYFISASGAARSLHKIAAGARPRVVAREFGYDSLTRSGNSRWLVSQNFRTREMAVVDTQTEVIQPIGKHDSATVLADGQLLFVKGSEMTVGDSTCKADSHTDTVDRKTENLHLQDSRALSTTQRPRVTPEKIVLKLAPLFDGWNRAWPPWRRAELAHCGGE